MIEDFTALEMKRRRAIPPIPIGRFTTPRMAKPIDQVKSESFFPPYSSRQRALINPSRGVSSSHLTVHSSSAN
jgi:hypothetical protein